jgi:hypothetical protein
MTIRRLSNAKQSKSFWSLRDLTLSQLGRSVFDEIIVIEAPETEEITLTRLLTPESTR